MEKELAPTEQAVGFVQTDENIQLLKTTLTSAGTNLSDNELRLFLYQTKRTGLDPLARQIYVMKSGNRLSFITSIDGQRLIAQRTGEYKGQVGPMWCGRDGEWVDVWLQDEPPAAAKVGVYREGFSEPVYGVARWKSYAKSTPTWNQLGDLMLAKCAEALALRKAFPQELSDIYTAEEMEHTTPSVQKPEVVNTPKPASITDQQKLQMSTLLAEKGVPTQHQKTTMLGFSEATLQRKVKDLNKLTYDDAAALIQALEQSEPEALSMFVEGEQ